MNNLSIHIFACNYHGHLKLVMRFFVWKIDEEDDTGTYLDFQHKLAWELIKNDLFKSEREEVEEERKMLLHNNNDHVSVPHCATKFENRKWISKAKQEYQQNLCRTWGCNKNFKFVSLVWLGIQSVLLVMENTIIMLKNNLLFEVIESVFKNFNFLWIDFLGFL